MRFDVTLKAETNVAPVAIGPTQIGLQLARAVLAERFAFQAHRETRERPVFALVRVRPDGPLGPRLRQSRNRLRRARSPGRRVRGALAAAVRGAAAFSASATQGATVTAGGYPMAEFRRFLTGQTQRVVIDRTGLAGAWDFELTFAPRGGRSRVGRDPIPVYRATGTARVEARRDAWAGRRAGRRPHRATHAGLASDPGRSSGCPRAVDEPLATSADPAGSASPATRLQ